MRPGRLGWLLLVMSLTLGGCSDSEPAESAPRTSSSPTAESPKPNQDRAYESVSFAAPDGERRSGRLYGDGAVAVVLTHMGRPIDGPGDWDGFARQLADRGFQALTYRRRLLYGTMWQDVLGAADYLRRHGARKVIAGGASIGAMASLRAAEEPEVALDGVIWLAGVLFGNGYDFQKSDVSGIDCPILVVSGDDDDYFAGPTRGNCIDGLRRPRSCSSWIATGTAPTSSRRTARILVS